MPVISIVNRVPKINRKKLFNHQPVLQTSKAPNLGPVIDGNFPDAWSLCDVLEVKTIVTKNPMLEIILNRKNMLLVAVPQKVVPNEGFTRHLPLYFVAQTGLTGAR